jgi:hypothetical protein
MATLVARSVGPIIYFRIVYGSFIITGVSVHITCFSNNVLITSADIIECSLRLNSHIRSYNIVKGSKLVHGILDTFDNYLYNNRFLITDTWRIIHDAGVGRLLDRLITAVDDYMW